MSLFRDEVLRVLHTALVFAEQHLLQGESPMTAEMEGAPYLATGDKEDLLWRLVNDPEPSQADLDAHTGLPPIPADRRTHTLIAELLERAFPGCHVVGEEARDDEWESAENAAAGALIFSVDAIDGSLPYDTLSFGYSTNLLAFNRTADQDTHLVLAVVANSSQFVAVFEEPGNVFVGSLRNFGEIGPDEIPRPSRLRSVTEPYCDDYREGTVAVVAAQAQHRAAVRTLFDDESLTVFTTGGAPAALGLVIGRLEALVVASGQTTHDAAYLPVLAALNMSVLTEAGTALTLPVVLDYFSSVACNKRDRVGQPVPPFVAARSPQVAGRLAAAVFRGSSE